MTAPYPSLQRLVEKKTGLGFIRELQPPQSHMGLSIAPFKEVPTDDVIFDYIKGGLQEGLAPARAEDAESELSQKDLTGSTSGRASIVDWAIKDTYTASDVNRYREALLLQQQTQGISSTVGGQSILTNITADFNARVARDDALRRRKLDNRLEWLIMTALQTGQIGYNDGTIKFLVDFGRPADQNGVNPASGVFFDDAAGNGDPINDINAMNELMYSRYGVRLRRAIISRKIVQSWWKSKRFQVAALGGLVVGGTPSSTLDPAYINPSWGPQQALQMVQDGTDVQFTVYDSVYRTRAIGSTTSVNNRFTDEKKIIFLPAEGDLAEIDDTDIGFAKTLISPHPEGNWTPGFYEWEQETIDPWRHNRGTGIKAFPVFPLMEYSYVMNALT
jgi:hypothetical protein